MSGPDSARGVCQSEDKGTSSNRGDMKTDTVLKGERSKVAAAWAVHVFTGTGGIVEIQGTAEQKPFTPAQFQELLALAQGGITELTRLQNAILEK